jgi:hypothetical protein
MNHPTVKKLVAKARKTDNPPEAVIAYRSSRKAKDEQPVGELDTSKTIPQDERYHLFGWEIFVPEDSELNDLKLLKKTARFATRSDLRETRQSFQGLVKRLSEGGVTPDDATTELTRLLKEYQELTRRAWRNSAVRWTARLAPIAAPFAALLSPWIGAGAGAAAVALPLAIERFASKPEVRDRLKPVIYVNEARKFFRKRWYSNLIVGN